MWIDRLDKPPENSLEPTLYVYPVQHGSAAHLAKLLNDIYGGGGSSGGSSGSEADSGVAPGMQTSSISSSAGTGSSSSGSSSSSLLGTSGSTSSSGGIMGSSSGTSGSGRTGLLAGSTSANGSNDNSNDTASANVSLKGAGGSEIKVVADAQNNALLIYARRQDYQKIANALRRLDVQPLQVLIEASIIEVTLSGNLQYGLEWYLQGSLGSGLTGSAGLNFNSTGAISPSQPGFSYSITNGAGAVRAVLNALAQKSLVKVISSPSVLVLNNNTANIQVGTQQPIAGPTAITTGVVSTSYTYKDTGVTLAVTPSVNAGGMVRMNIKQAVTDVGAVDSATQQRSFLQRQIDTKVEVHSGQTVTLGGLIKNNVSNGKSGIPVLSDIPVLGNLFSTTTKTDDRTELLVMITPRVLKNPQDLTDITQEMRERMSSLEALEHSANYVGIGRSNSGQTQPAADKATAGSSTSAPATP